MTAPAIKSNRAERREINRAIKRAGKRGNDCCGQPMSRLMPSLLLRTSSGIKVWHTTCPTPPGAICIGVMSAECSDKNPDIEVDRIWFEAHPDAEFYWRKAQPEEWERWYVSRQHLALQNSIPLDGPLVDCPEEHRHMAVRQLEPGKRSRLPIVISPEFPPPTVERMRAQFVRAFGENKVLPMTVDPAVIAATVAAKAFGGIPHDLLDIAAAEGESLSAIKH